MPHKFGRVAPGKSEARLQRGITIPAKAVAWRVVTPGGTMFKAVKVAKFKAGASNFVVMRLMPYKSS